MSNPYLQVGKKIRLYRKARKLTQEELGEILKIDQSYIGRIERGEVNITLDTIYKISDALQITPVQLLEDEKNDREGKLRTDILDKIDILLIPLTVDELQGVHRVIKEVLALKNINKGKHP
ncbi:DNA-binding helix-turn-helix protein [Paenibacillus algicola]|uniref:DNA-binding helix-turn-helix protein n=1 Tax=Paenibacillus algicola TaxID=2565926 RepID=A0A4V1G4E2_9BACL|nr:helix-turn-helix transcriptional regulator [Paenibacillus algicola]QCT04384.1 DNA-binding helix-turn-helix protein [Paenibacillus algicola]